jgi:hypothetical protein
MIGIAFFIATVPILVATSSEGVDFACE